jgi:alpha-tubulin suppressor-like RCC1 family protein
MSTINVNNLSGKGGATPNLPDGAVISGVATVTNLKPTNVSVSGAVTATTFDGSLKSTGTPTLGLGVTINASGISISGVATVGVLTGGTYYGDGSNLAGVGESIAPWNYNPNVNDQEVTVDTGIGITFNKKVLAGSGTATIKIVNAGAAGTTIQSWGVSSCTFNVTQFTLGSLVSVLTVNETYQVDIPSGFIVDSGGTAYAGTAYTFSLQDPVNKLWVWGNNESGELAQGYAVSPVDAASSPVQIPGTWKAGWANKASPTAYYGAAINTDGELWSWGYQYGAGLLGLNEGGPGKDKSSPVQVPGTTWSSVSNAQAQVLATKTDGTLWTWGNNEYGNLGLNAPDNSWKSSPTQIPGTTWSENFAAGTNVASAIKTDGTLWMWGRNDNGQLGLNDVARRSSPVQVPGTTWKYIVGVKGNSLATKTDGTLWVWGDNEYGQLGQNAAVTARKSSPVQVPGTTWALLAVTYTGVAATKTNGTLWTWGRSEYGQGGQNDVVNRSSPVQVPGTTWGTNNINHLSGQWKGIHTIKTDGTLWSWGRNQKGELGQNNKVDYSSPVQVGSRTDWDQVSSGAINTFAIQADGTP